MDLSWHGINLVEFKEHLPSLTNIIYRGRYAVVYHVNTYAVKFTHDALQGYILALAVLGIAPFSTWRSSV